MAQADGESVASVESEPTSISQDAIDQIAKNWAGPGLADSTETLEVTQDMLPIAAENCSPEDTQGRSLCFGLAEEEFSKAELREALSDPPGLVDWCDGVTTNEFNRTEACLADWSPIEVIIQLQGRPIGEAHWAMRQEIKLHTNPARVEQAIWLVPMDMDPSLGSVTLDWKPADSCGSDCTRGLQEWDGSLTWTPESLHSATGFQTIDWTVPATKADKEFTLAWGLDAYSPAAPTDPESLEYGTWPPLDVRCDNIVTGLNAHPGCVFPQYYPHMEYSMTGPYPELARHIAMAVEFGFPNPRTYPLTRITNATDIRANGRRACPESYPRPEGKTCDEFPFRTTAQGAYMVDPDGSLGLKPLELPDCGVQIADPATPWGDDIGYSVCMIDGNQNRDGGRELGEFYRENRVLESDPFHVDITH